MGGAKACCFVILMALAVLVFWSCGLVLSIYEIAVGAYAFDSKDSRVPATTATAAAGPSTAVPTLAASSSAPLSTSAAAANASSGSSQSSGGVPSVPAVASTAGSSSSSSGGFGPCSWKISEDGVDLLPLYLIVSGLIWIAWTVCSALIRCSDAERSTGFYIGSGDLKVHCVTNGESRSRNIIRKFFSSILLVCAVAWTVAGTIFTFLGRVDRSKCADATFQSARVTIIIRWAWIAFIVLVSLLLKVMQYALASRRRTAGAAAPVAQELDGEKGKPAAY